MGIETKHKYEQTEHQRQIVMSTLQVAEMFFVSLLPGTTSSESSSTNVLHAIFFQPAEQYPSAVPFFVILRIAERDLKQVFRLIHFSLHGCSRGEGGDHAFERLLLSLQCEVVLNSSTVK